MAVPETAGELASKIAEATQLYAQKNYAAAADSYSEATQLQADQNGEMAPENAELLYAYGRCLYHVAVGNSDVLGGKVAGSGGGDKPRGKKRKVAATENEDGESTRAAVAGPSKSGEASHDTVKKQDGKTNTPFFQIEGDDADWDSDDAEEDGVDTGADGDDSGVQEDEEEDDDFAIAYEVLDIARVLLLRQLEALQPTDPEPLNKGKGKATTSTSILPQLPPTVRKLQELLADNYDLQAEISLENENFSAAATDFSSSLSLKQSLHPQDSSIIAEAHYKVSLALEFAAKTTSSTDRKPGSSLTAIAEDSEGVDEEMRKESASHMEKAIESTCLRVEREEAEIPLAPADEQDSKRKAIEEVKLLIQDMEQRLLDLRAPTVTLNAALLSNASGATSILHSMLSGSDPAASLADITSHANDVTGLVRKKFVPAHVNGNESGDGKGKRKLKEVGSNEVVDIGNGNANGKRAKVAEEGELV